jgi:hypothetical protein
MATDKIHNAIRFDADTYHKLKYISWHDRKTFTEICGTSFEEFIKRWEKANGAITEAQIRQSQKK